MYSIGETSISAWSVCRHFARSSEDCRIQGMVLALKEQLGKNAGSFALEDSDSPCTNCHLICQ